MASNRQSKHCFGSLVGTGWRPQHLELPDQIILQTSASIAVCMTPSMAWRGSSSTAESGKYSVMILIFYEKESSASTLGSSCLGNFDDWIYSPTSLWSWTRLLGCRCVDESQPGSMQIWLSCKTVPLYIYIYISRCIVSLTEYRSRSAWRRRRFAGSTGHPDTGILRFPPDAGLWMTERDSTRSQCRF